MKKFFKIFILIVILGGFVYTIYFLYEKSQAKPVVYETTNAIETNIIKKTVATGSVVPRKEIEIKPMVSGIIEEIFVQEGSMIRKNDLIAKVRIIPNMVNLNNAESRVNRAKIALENAERNFKRQKELYAQSVISKTQYEQYELEYQNVEDHEIKDLPMGNPPNDYGQYIGSMSNHGMVYENIVDVLNNNGIIATNGFEGMKTVEIIDKIYAKAR